MSRSITNSGPHRFPNPMPIRAFAFALGVFVATHAVASDVVQPTTELPVPVAERMRAAGIPTDAIGITVRRLSDGAQTLGYNAERSLQPASTLKLLTSLVALETLGPAYRGRTELRW